LRIRIGSGFNQFSGSGFGIQIRIQEGKNDPRKKKRFHVLKCLMFSDEGIPVAWSSFMEGIRVDPDSDRWYSLPYSAKMIDSDPGSVFS
jgi:hypothetical protein